MNHPAGLLYCAVLGKFCGSGCLLDTSPCRQQRPWVHSACMQEQLQLPAARLCKLQDSLPSPGRVSPYGCMHLLLLLKDLLHLTQPLTLSFCLLARPSALSLTTLVIPSALVIQHLLLCLGLLRSAGARGLVSMPVGVCWKQHVCV